MRRLDPPGSSETSEGRILPSLQLAVGAALVLIGSTADNVLIVVPAVAVGTAIGLPALARLLPKGTIVAARGLPAAVAVMALMCMAFFGAEAFLPLTLNEVRGQSPTMAGLALTAATLTWAGASWVQAHRAQAWSRRTMIIAGFVFVCAGVIIAGLTAWSEVPVIAAAVGWAVAGFGMGLAYSNIALSILSDEQAGTASVSLNFASTLGIAAGTGLGGAVIAAGESLDWSQAGSVSIVFALMAGFALLAVAVAFRLPAGRPAATPTSAA
jgi:predicted MFS family arabinose efflux permease